MSALAGITILELSCVLAGPWCGMMLADLGAEVVKLEPLEGDATRGLGPPFQAGISAYFSCCNRNKRSLAIDLRAPASRPLVEALVRSADVLVENFRTGAAEALGLGWESVHALNPRLVYCSISGYGRTGPAAAKPGYDYAIQAEAGLMAITGEADGAPHKVGVAVADLATGQNAAIAILAALRHRDRTGQGQRIDVSLFDSQLAGLANVAANALFSGVDAPRYGNTHPSIVPYETFAASDGAFVLAVASEKLWARLCAALDRPQWRDDARWADNAARVANRASLRAALAETFATDTVAHWLATFEAAGVPAAPIHTVRQALDSDVAHARGMRIELGGLPLVGSPLNLSLTPVEFCLPPPRLGEHTDEIAARHGFDAAALRAAGAVQ